MNRKNLILALTLALALVAGGCGFPSASATGGNPAAGGQNCTVSAVAPGLQGEQITNAQAIAGVALGLGLGVQGVQVGLVAALTESGMRNLNYGDISSVTGQMTTSRGMFQMMDAWGPLADRLDPTKAATIFYTIDKGPGVRGLMHIDGWQSMPIHKAAQSVEGSQFSDGSNYLNNVAQAQAIAAVLTATAPQCTGTTPGGPGPGPAPGLNPSQDPASFGWVHAGPMEPLVWQGHNFGQVARGTAALWSKMLTDLVPQIPGGLDSNLGCFEDRSNVNNPSVLSFHAYGIACDLNSGVNCNGCSAQSLQGKTGALPMSTAQIVGRWGFEWGGTWTGTPDPMHIELAISPQQVAQLLGGQAP